MFLPLHIRLTLFYGLILTLALCFFSNLVYQQASQRAYSDLDEKLKSRAASIQLGKDLYMQDTTKSNTLPSVDGFGKGIAIEVLDKELHVLVSSKPIKGDPGQTQIQGLSDPPSPCWDASTAHRLISSATSNTSSLNAYNTIRYHDQNVRVYTVFNPNTEHIIQTAYAQTEIEQSQEELLQVLIRGVLVVLFIALLGGWFITWWVLARVRAITQTAQTIAISRNFSQRVPLSTRRQRHDELMILAATFNQMLSNLEEVYLRQQRFVADASHELRAPITSIRCNLDLLTTAHDLPEQEHLAALQDARSEAERMGRLVNELLQLAHADSKNTENLSAQQAPHHECVDLDSIVLETFRQYRTLVESSPESHPHLSLQHITPAQVYGDTDRLKQAIVVLLDNAFKYTSAEGQVILSLSTTPTTALVHVSDTGIGISQADLPHIFERFYRAEHSRTRNQGGSGLGLSIVQSILHEHRGTIEAESTPGKGSTFTLKLPLVGEEIAPQESTNMMAS